MKLKTITPERLEQIEKASLGDIKFKTVNNAIVSIVFQGPLGPIFIEVGSYSVVTVNELATKKIFKLGFFKQVADQKLFLEKEFKTKEEREEYINEYLYDSDREELVIDEFEITEDSN